MKRIFTSKYIETRGKDNVIFKLCIKLMLRCDKVWFLFRVYKYYKHVLQALRSNAAKVKKKNCNFHHVFMYCVRLKNEIRRHSFSRKKAFRIIFFIPHYKALILKWLGKWVLNILYTIRLKISFTVSLYIAYIQITLVRICTRLEYSLSFAKVLLFLLNYS